MDHTWDNGKITTPAKCEQDGVKTYTCTVCGETKAEEIPATGHHDVVDPAVDPTCTEPGKTAGSHCDVCGKVLKAQEEIPAKGHTWDEGKITKKATLSKPGIRTRTCTVCGETKEEAIPSFKQSWQKTHISDVMVFYRAATGQEKLPEDTGAADFDESGALDIFDVLVLYLLVSGKV